MYFVLFCLFFGYFWFSSFVFHSSLYHHHFALTKKWTLKWLYTKFLILCKMNKTEKNFFLQEKYYRIFIISFHSIIESLRKFSFFRFFNFKIMNNVRLMLIKLIRCHFCWWWKFNKVKTKKNEKKKKKDFIKVLHFCPVCMYVSVQVLREKKRKISRSSSS